jgi:hypothetical protein
MLAHRAKPTWFAWFLAVAFLAIQAIALAHELKHDLRQHDDSSCVLHLYTKHAGGKLNAGSLLPTLYTASESPTFPDTTILVSTSALGYRTRAPPVIA